MKTKLLLLLVATLGFASCKKDKDERKLTGRWDLSKRVYTTTTGGVKTEDSESYNADDFYIVFDGNKFTMYDEGEAEDTGTFSVTATSVTLYDDDSDDSETYGLNWVSNSEINITSEENYSDSGVATNLKIQETYKKH